ncbi:CRISPR-associated endonuclease Cas2 [Thalassospira povalilytica]|uniref:CRISPR-associated endonuclease Cas2 n=1 Tax=Thalassospira povalilytica TaxID=732237 RepID=UPI003AA9B52D
MIPARDGILTGIGKGENAMARGEMLTVFSYDVSENKRRRKVARILEDAATRVQYSVFEASMSKMRADSLGQRIAALLGDGDSLRVYVIGADGRARSRVYGDAAPFESEEGYWLL